MERDTSAREHRTESTTANDGDGSPASRRTILSAVGGLGILAASPITASADGDGEGSRSDVDVLNFALTLEHLENEFYKQQLSEFSEQDFRGSDLFTGFGPEVRFSAREYLRVIQQHEAAHVEFLTEAIEKAGGDPVSVAGEYDFAAPLGKSEIETVAEFAAVAQALEATGVDAYAGAAPSIDNPAYVPPALSIHSVEANHAAYLRTLNGEVPFPTAFNEAKSIDEVLEIVDPIIVEP